MCGTRFSFVYYGPFKHVTQKVESYGEVFITLNPSKPLNTRVKEQLIGHCEQMLKAFVHQTRSVLQTLSLEQQKERRGRGVLSQKCNIYTKV
jgi:hypothetical protein